MQKRELRLLRRGDFPASYIWRLLRKGLGETASARLRSSPGIMSQVSRIESRQTAGGDLLAISRAEEEGSSLSQRLQPYGFFRGNSLLNTECGNGAY